MTAVHVLDCGCERLIAPPYTVRDDRWTDDDDDLYVRAGRDLLVALLGPRWADGDPIVAFGAREDGSMDLELYVAPWEVHHLPTPHVATRTEVRTPASRRGS